MEKNKIPIWENEKRYRDDVSFVVSDLLGLSDREFQIRIWCRCEGPEVDSYTDALLNFDYSISYMKYVLRNNEISLTTEQIRAIMRVHVMCNAFVRAEWYEDAPEEWEAQHLYLINHPYWIKITEKAKYALSLLKKPVP